MWRRVWHGWQSLFQINRMERDMEQEFRFHLEMETAENVRRGMDREQAGRTARLSFGGIARAKEACRDASRLRPLETLWQDVRYGLRILFRNPGFTLVAALTLALGIGANTAIFSVIYGVLLRPLPYQEGDRLVVLQQQAPLAHIDNMRFSVKEIADYRAQNQTLANVVEYHSMTFLLLGGAEPENIQAGVVSWNFFELMGVTPMLGRTFLPNDETRGADAVLVLSYQYWQRSHGGDPHIVGKVFKMNDRPHTVIGVLPPIPQYPNENDVYMPTSACPTRSSERFMANRNARMMSVFGRLKPGVSVTQSQADLCTIANRLQQSYPESYSTHSGYSIKSAFLQEELTRQARPTFLILLGTAGLVLLITCANVANLMLARLMRREQEMAMRTALGASRARLIQQVLVESALVALMGGILGIGLAAAGLDLLIEFAARFTPRAHEIKLDGTMLLFTLTVSLITGFIFGLMPALSVKANLGTTLKEGTGHSTAGVTRQRIRSALIVAQVAVSFMLLIGAGLMLRSLFKLQQVNPGFDSERVLVMPLSINWSKYTTPEQSRNLSLQLIEKVKTQPGVISAAMADSYPLNPRGISFGPSYDQFLIEGQSPAERNVAPQADTHVVSPDYFHTIHLPLIQGRMFTEQDQEKAPHVAVVNQSLAHHRWGNENPIGKRVSFDQGESWLTIVGVIGDVKQYGLDRGATDELYTPIAQTFGVYNLLVRTASDPLNIARQTREVIYELDPEIAINSVQTLEEVRHESLASPRLTAILLVLFALLALIITAAGIAGVMALTVSQRTREIGIRIAFGATPESVIRMVLQQGMRLVLVGLVLGSLGAFVLTHLMSSLLYAVEPTDPLTFLAVSLVLLAAAATACYVPARRVTLIDPIAALRSE